MATPLKPRRGRGRPRSQDKLLIDSERQTFKLKSRIIEITSEAIEVIYDVMKDTKAPPQVRSGNAKTILELSSEIYKELIESESTQDDIEAPVEEVIEEEKGIVVNFGG